jgi:hypothetical protein
VWSTQPPLGDLPCSFKVTFATLFVLSWQNRQDAKQELSLITFDGSEEGTRPPPCFLLTIL